MTEHTYSTRTLTSQYSPPRLLRSLCVQLKDDSLSSVWILKIFYLIFGENKDVIKENCHVFIYFPSSKSETSRNDVIILSSTCTSSSSNLYPYYLTQEANPPQILQCHRTDLIFLYCGNLIFVQLSETVNSKAVLLNVQTCYLWCLKT